MYYCRRGWGSFMAKKGLFYALCISFGLFVLRGLSAQEVTVDTDNTLRQLALSNPEYIVCAGDVYTLNFAVGGSRVEYTIQLDTSYMLRVANLAVIDVAGKKFTEVKESVEDIVSKNYQFSAAQFTLVTPARFTVLVTGDTVDSTEITTWGGERLSAIIGQVAAPYASARFVSVETPDGEITEYDLFQAERFGDMSQNPFMSPGDIIRLKRYDRRVSIEGAVERPGTYEILADEGLDELITYYGGGLTDFADVDTIFLRRLLEPALQDADAGEYIHLDYETVFRDGRFVYDLKDYDTVHIDSVLRLKPVFFLEGAVMQEDEDAAAGGIVVKQNTENVTAAAASQRLVVPFTAGEDYGDIVRRMDGYFSAQSNTREAYIIRGAEIIPLNITDLLYNTVQLSGITAEPFDTVVVPFELYYVTVAGAVRLPGRFPYVPDRDWEYYIGLAGGFTEENDFKNVVIQGPDGQKLSKDDTIVPETTITARRNGLLYNFNRFAVPITTLLSVTSTILMFLNLAQ